MNKIIDSRTLGFLDDQIATMKDKDIKWCAPIADRREIFIITKYQLFP